MSLLELNKQKSLWAPLPEPRRFDGKTKGSQPTKCWQSEDFKFYAEQYGSNGIVIFSKAYVEKAQQLEKQSREEKERKDKEKIKGF